MTVQMVSMIHLMTVMIMMMMVSVMMVTQNQIVPQMTPMTVEFVLVVMQIRIVLEYVLVTQY